MLSQTTLCRSCLALMLLLPAVAAAAPAARPGPSPSRVGKPPGLPATQAIRIVAVVNGDPVTNVDVDNRTRLFAMATGLPVSADMLDRLKPQIVRQLVDERLRMQEIQQRKIVVSDKEIAAAIAEVEQRNGMKPGGLRAKLASDGVSFITLVDQIRTQLGWTRVLRQAIGDRLQITDADVAEQ